MSKRNTYLLSHDLNPSLRPGDVALEVPYYTNEDEGDTEHGQKAENAPADRCGYVTNPAKDCGEAEHQNCCYRETWNKGEYCVWHTPLETEAVEATEGSQYTVQLPTESKPADELERVRESPENRKLNRNNQYHGYYGTPSELLDGALIAKTNLGELSDLQACFIRGGDLRQVIGTGISLEFCNFSGSDLSYSKILRCDVGYSVFDNVRCIKGDLTGTRWRGAYIRGADLTGSDLSNIGSGETAKLSGSRLWNVNGRGMKISRVDLTGVDFHDADLEEARIDCELNGATFKRAILRGAEIGHSAKDANFERANLTEAILTGLNAEGASFENAILNRADLSDANLVNARLLGAVLADCQIDERTKFFRVQESRRFVTWIYSPNRSVKGYCIYDPRGKVDESEPSESRFLDEIETSYNSATSMYRLIEVLGRNNARPRLQSTAFVRRQEAQTKQYKIDQDYLNYYYNKLSGILFQYGDSIWRVVLWSFVIILFFAGIYAVGGFIEPTSSSGELATHDQILPSELDYLWVAVYYSALTFTSLGFESYKPIGFIGQLLTVAETTSGAVLIALLVFVLGRRATQ